MMKGGLAVDPKGLVYESYRIAGISPAECRTIFLDWALSLPSEADIRDALTRLMVHYGADHPDHPMTAVLREGLERAAQPARRRGGSRRTSPD